VQKTTPNLRFVLNETINDWWEDNAPRLGAALAYYTLFSLAPLLIIVIALAGLIFGRDVAQGYIVTQIQGLVGPEGAGAIQAMIESARKPATGILASLFGLTMLLIGATGLFTELQSALNTIWEVPEKAKAGLLSLLKNRLLSFTMVLGMGFLLLVSLVVSAALAAAGSFLSSIIPSVVVVGELLNLVVSLVVITLMFAMIFKYLPDVTIAWNDVWIGAVATALLFTVGKSLLGLYLGTSSVASAYGAASSLVIILIWVYYSAQIFLLGAEFTQVYSTLRGSRLSYPGSSPKVQASASR
jgi:membrane protein